MKAGVLVSLYLISFYVSCNAQSQWVLSNETGRLVYKAPEFCKNFGKNLSRYEAVEDFDLCAPAMLEDYAQNYYHAAALRRATYFENLRAYKRLQILPKVLQDVSHVDLTTTVLGNRLSIPICASPSALHGFASDLGEIDTVRGISEAGTLMILSSYSGTPLEDVAKASTGAVLWMQTYIFTKREVTIDILRRAEKSGFKAIVVTIDSPTAHTTSGSRFTIIPNPKNITFINVEKPGDPELDPSNPTLTFHDLVWLKRHTRLPIIAKGILTAQDAVLAVRNGASGILVSNHGGRQLDYVPATIDVLPSIVDAVQKLNPAVEVYVDGGIRSGIDVFKALSRGARMACVGRPVLWGLAVQEQEGVEKVFDILKDELNQTMMLAGAPNVDSIKRKMVKYTGSFTAHDRDFIL